MSVGHAEHGRFCLCVCVCVFVSVLNVTWLGHDENVLLEVSCCVCVVHVRFHVHLWPDHLQAVTMPSDRPAPAPALMGLIGLVLTGRSSIVPDRSPFYLTPTSLGPPQLQNMLEKRHRLINNAMNDRDGSA